MSVLQQQRIRIVSTMDGSREPWATFCPCCHWADVHSTWSRAVAWADDHQRQYHCRFCIDHQMPAGRDDVLGEVFERCPLCTEPCPSCWGLAVYPAKYDTPTEMADDLATFNHYAVLCGVCHGVTETVPFVYPEDLP